MRSTKRTREQERAKKRRQRARRYARGLTRDGTTPVRPWQVEAQRAAKGWHPADCACHDCLWGEVPAGTKEEQAIFRRMGLSA